MRVSVKVFEVFFKSPSAYCAQQVEVEIIPKPTEKKISQQLLKQICVPLVKTDSGKPRKVGLIGAIGALEAKD